MILPKKKKKTMMCVLLLIFDITYQKYKLKRCKSHIGYTALV